VTRQTLAADVVDALLTVWRADVTLAAYTTRLAIFDGPPVTDRAEEIELWVGASGTAPDEEVISGAQQYVTMRQVDDRDETLDVTCAIWVANGSHDIAAARRLAIDVFNAAAGAIRATDLGIADLDDTAEVTEWRLRQGQFTSGVGAVLDFTVRVTGQL
jgi:hypothetical protein